jgi:hypothetical protein
VIHTRQVLQGFHTKDDILKRFGTPDQKKQGVGVEEWAYHIGSVAAAAQSNKTDPVQNHPLKLNTDSLNKASPDNKSIRFMIDTNNNVIGYKNEGVDLTRKVKQNPVLVSLNFMGQVLIGAIALGLYFGLENYINW